MRILWLNAGLLLPLDKGGRLRTWHLLRHLAQQHEITYLSFADPGTSPAEREGMREVCAHLQVVPRTDPDKGTLAFYADAATRIFDPLPYAIGKYVRPLSRQGRATAATGAFDLVVVASGPAVNSPIGCPAHPCSSRTTSRRRSGGVHYEGQTDPVRRFLFPSSGTKLPL